MWIDSVLMWLSILIGFLILYNQHWLTAISDIIFGWSTHHFFVHFFRVMWKVIIVWVGVYISWVPLAKYRHCGWEVSADAVYLWQGWMPREIIITSLADIRKATTVRTIGDRCAGSARIKLSSHSGNDPLYLICSSKTHADSMADHVNRLSTNSLPEKPKPHKVTSTADDELIVKAPWSWFRFAGATMSGFYSQIISFVLILRQRDTDSFLGKKIAKFTLIPEQRYGLAGRWLVLLGLSIAIGLILAHLVYCIWYMNFRLLQNKNGDFYTRRGYGFSRTRYIPHTHIFGCELKRPIFLRAANGARVYALLSGRIRAALLPPASMYGACVTGAYVLGETDNIFYIELFTAPEVTLQRKRLHIFVPIALLSFISEILILLNSTHLGSMIFPLVASWLAWHLAQYSYNNIGYGYTDKYFIVQSGTFNLRRAALDKNYIQGWKFQQTPWQRKHNICNLTVLSSIGLKENRVTAISESQATDIINGCIPEMTNQFLK